MVVIPQNAMCAQKELIRRTVTVMHKDKSAVNAVFLVERTYLIARNVKMI